jgi:hypothetical protein
VRGLAPRQYGVCELVVDAHGRTQSCHAKAEALLRQQEKSHKRDGVPRRPARAIVTHRAAVPVGPSLISPFCPWRAWRAIRRRRRHP